MTWARSFISSLFVVALLFTLYIVLYEPTQEKQSAQRDMVVVLETDIETLTSRVADLAQSGPEQSFPDALLWLAEDKVDAELSLQDAVIGLLGQTGMTVITFAGSSLDRNTTQDVLAFEFEAEGALGDLLVFLAELEKLEPKVAIGVLRLRPAQRYDLENVDDVNVYIQVSVWSYWQGAT